MMTASPTLISSAQSRASKPNVDYKRFEQLARAIDDGISLAISGRRGWNADAINGIYDQDGELNGRPRLRKRGDQRWLKFNDAQQWMVSRHSDGRPLGEAFALHAPEAPFSIRGHWMVSTESKVWERDDSMTVTSCGCFGCGAMLAHPLRCGRCRRVSYCSSKCQRSDWVYHKRNCIQPTMQPTASVASNAVQAADLEEETDDEELLRSAVREQHAAARSSRASASEGLVSSAPILLEESREVVPAPPPLKQLSSWNAAGTWEERNLLPFAQKRLTAMLQADAERSCLPELRVASSDEVWVEVLRVEDVKGFATLGMNRGQRRHLFDLSFNLQFRASWIGDHGVMSTEGSVCVTDFWPDLEAVCGMEVIFAQGAESQQEETRRAFSVALPAGRHESILQALGASRRAVLAGTGLMYRVHCRLRCFAEEFKQQ